MRILIIDDDAVDFEIMTRALLRHESTMQFERASTGHEGLQKINNSIFDAVVVDYILPDEDGLELIKKIREISIAPVIFVTGHGNEMIATQAIQSGCQNYFSKDSISKESELFYEILSSPRNMKFLEVLASLNMLKSNTKKIDAEVSLLHLRLNNQNNDTLDYI